MKFRSFTDYFCTLKVFFSFFLFFFFFSSPQYSQALLLIRMMDGAELWLQPSPAASWELRDTEGEVGKEGRCALGQGQEVVMVGGGF